jgi:nucleoid-associated protein
MPLDPALNADVDAGNPSVKVNRLVVHRLGKDGDRFVPRLRDKLNALSDTNLKVVRKLVDEYSKRSGKAHGKFEIDVANYPVQTHLSNYYVDRNTSFLDATKEMMGTLCAKAQGTSATAGGVIIAETEHNGVEHLLVAIVTEQWGAAMNADMELADSDHLDLKGFRFAGRVNLSEWVAGSETYLSFLRGKGQVAAYFMEFLGCTDSVSDKAETKTLKDALEHFASKSRLNEEKKREFFDRAYDICARHSAKKIPIDLEVFANELWPDNPKELTDILAEPERKLSDGFVPDRRVFKSFVQFTGQTDNWKIEFSRDAINRDIIFNKDETITLKNVPADLKERLRREIESEEDE